MSNITFNGETAVHAKSEGILTTSDVCMTPPFCIPISYTNIAESKMADMCATSVKIQGSPACNQKSNFKISKGDAPGACGGTSSGSVGQMAEFLEGSQDIKIEGKPAVRNNDQMVSNLKNTAPQPLVQPPAGKAPVGKAEATEAEKAFSQQFDFADLIGVAPGTNQILERPPYEITDKDGNIILAGSLDKHGQTERMFTPEKQDLIVWLGDGDWKIFSDQQHTGYEHQEETATTATMSFNFANFASAPIPELGYKFVVDGKEHTGKTDATGKAETLTGIPSGATVAVSVLRAVDQTYKPIGQIKPSAGESQHVIVSSKIKLEAATDEHTKKTPPPATPKASGKTKSATTPSQKEMKTETKTGPDGYPLAKLAEDYLELLVKTSPPNVLKTLFHWTWASFKAGSIANGHHKIVKPAMASPVPLGEPLTDDNQALLDNLIEIAEAQVKLDYSECRNQPDKSIAQGVLDKYDEDYDFPDKVDAAHPDKDVATKSLGICLAYVVIALKRAGYINGIGKAGLAKESVNDWPVFGYKDVSKERPPIEVTYLKAYAEKDIPKVERVCAAEAKLAKLKKDLPDLQHKASDAKKANDTHKTEAAEKAVATQNREIDATEQDLAYAKKKAPEKQDVVTYTQPDLMYTLPGDLIVYEKVDPIKEANPAGHIDIRTYHGFCSDFANPRTIPALGVSGLSRYRVIGIFRKISDTMAMARVQAFLRILRELETEGYKDPYRALPRDKNNQEVTFEGFDTHPSDEKRNVAAGAYQIRWVTWNEVINATGWPRTFTPEMQERIALFRLQQRPMEKKFHHPRRTALGYITEGKIEKAINETELWNEWSCLPGAAKSNEVRITMAEIKRRYQEYSGEEAK